MKITLAHDFVRAGGAERVLEEMHGLWPQAPIYTLLAERHPEYAGWDIRPTWLQRVIPSSMYRVPFPIYPRVVEGIRIPADTDLLISISVSWMKSLLVPEGAKHLCYICRPMMFAYSRQKDFLSRYPAPVRPLLRLLANRVGEWDRRTAGRPDQYISISKYTADRVRECYGIDSDVIHPPVQIQPYEEAGRKIGQGQYYLTVSRLESYKRVDVVVDACTRMNLPLKVAGQGPDLPRLKARAGPTVEFLGFVPNAELPNLMAGCRAFLFAAEEDFGIAPVEAQAAGRAVLAYGAGGCLETVLAGETGLHFERQEPESLMAAIEEFQDRSFQPERARVNARGFAIEVFREKLSVAANRLLSGSSESGTAKA